MNFDDIIGNQKSNKKYKKEFDKEEWSKRKQEERQALYDLADKMADDLKDNSVLFKEYLDVQAQFDKYSVNNALLITAQMPVSTQLKDFEDWQKLGAYVKKNPKWVKILEPSNPYKRADGSIGTSYNPKRMLDISQTNMAPKTHHVEHSEKEMLRALLHQCPVDREVVDELPNNKNAQWNIEETTLKIKRGTEYPTVFIDIAKELAKVEMESCNSEELDNFKSYCVSYLICKKYDLDVSSFNFNDLPNAIKNMDISNIKLTLSDIKGALENINSRMNACFEMISREQKNKDNVR